MHIEVKICVLSVSMSIISSAVMTGRDKTDTVPADTAKTEVLKQSQVHAGRAVPARNITPLVKLYSRTDLPAAPRSSYESVLRMLPSVDVRERGAKSAQVDIALRGGTADQTMIMLNGIDFTDARTGHQSHSLPIDLESVSGMSLLEGVPGAGALNGAIDISTAPLYSRYLRSEISAGQYGYYYGNLSGAYTFENADIFASASVRNSDGYQKNTDFRNYNAYFRSRISSDKAGSFDFQLGGQSRKFGSNGFYAAYNPNQYEETSTVLTSLKWNAVFGNIASGASVSYRHNTDRYDWVRGTVSNRHVTDNVGADLFATLNWIGGNSTLGADFRYNKIKSSNLGEPLAEPLGPDGVFKKGQTRCVSNIYLKHNKAWEKAGLSAMGGASFSPYGTSGLWSASAWYNPFKGFSIKASTGESMRLPTFTDLYYTSSAQINNPDLVPEKAYTVNLGISWQNEHWFANADSYFRNTRNKIAWVWRDKFSVGDTEYTSKWHSEQQAKVLTWGVELSSGYINDESVLRRASLSYAFIDSNEKSAMTTSTVMDYLRHKAVASVELAFLKYFSLNISGAVFDRAGGYNDYEFDADGQPVRNEEGVMITHKRDFRPYFNLDARLECRLRNICVFVDGNNLTNTRYCDFGGVVMPGVWITSGVSVTLKK